jgi:hypothetical protein
MSSKKSKEPTIENLKITNKNYDNLVKDLEKGYSDMEFNNDFKKTVKSLIPKYYYNTIEYELHNVELALSNGWRRIMIDEIEYPRLSTRMDDIKTDDEFNCRLTDYIQSRIYLIPMNYVPYNESIKKAKFEINITNDDSEEMIVRSSDIKYLGNDDSKDNKCPIEWSPDVDIITLRSTKSIRIPINIEWGKNLNHHTYCCFARVSAFPLGSDTDKELPSSMTMHPTVHVNRAWILSFTNATEAVLLGWKTLLNILKKAHMALNDFKNNSKMPYSTQQLKVQIADAGKIRYEFFNETRTLTEIICRYSYLVYPDIKLICAGDDHPEDKSSLIYINHADHNNLLISGTQNAIKIVEKIIKLFK